MTSYPKKVSEVFGISNSVLADSYVDRGSLDEVIQRLLGRPTHIALRGESKCGKSWLRQRNIPDAIAVQCRLNKSATDLFVDCLSQLEIELTVEKSASYELKGSVSTKGQLGISLLAKMGVAAAIEAGRESSGRVQPVGHSVSDLRFIADIIKASGRRLVIEDFHYMSVDQRRAFAFDLKALWDYGVFVVIIGVWSQSNMLVFLNPDLTGRIEEVSIYWSDEDLDAIMGKGGRALNIAFGEELRKRAVADCFGNAGILQKLVLGTLDEAGIAQTAYEATTLSDISKLEAAEMAYADQLNPLYQKFAENVSGGIRTRQNSTGIYAHAMAVILDSPDKALMDGLSLDAIFEAAHKRQDRIQKGNLRKVLEKFEELQVDNEGRGLVLSYNKAISEVTIVDRQLLLYRRYATVKWPWEDMIAEADSAGGGYEA